MPSRTQKLEAHASHLLDLFIQLRERYAMLRPLLFEQKVVENWGRREKYQGFIILKNSLFLSCVQDIAKLTADDDPRTPSIRNQMQALEDPNLRAVFRERFIQWRIPVAEDEENDEELLEALQRLDHIEQAERSAQFDELYSEGVAAWRELSSDPTIAAFRTVRDKVTAHSELKYHVDKYQRVDIGSLGVVWGDLRTCVDRMQRLIEIIGMLVRNSSFAWESLDEQLEHAASRFWSSES